MGLLFLAGCADVPNNYNERAEKNYMVGCEDGSSKEYCGCVWDQLEKTVPWGDFNKFDNDQQTADEEKREIKVPAGIQKAFDTCIDNESGASTSSTEQQTTTTAKG